MNKLGFLSFVVVACTLVACNQYPPLSPSLLQNTDPPPAPSAPEPAASLPSPSTASAPSPDPSVPGPFSASSAAPSSSTNPQVTPPAEQSPNQFAVSAALPTDKDSLQKALYLCEAELSAVEIEGSILETDYRTGKVSRSDFMAQRANLLQQENSLELQEKQLELALRPLLLPPQYPAGTIQELLAKLQEVKIAEQTLELQEMQLKQQYLLKEITRAEFIEQKAELIRQEEELDAQEDLLEDALELLGWDD